MRLTIPARPFMNQVSELYDLARNSSDAVVAWGVKVTFPAFNNLPSLTKLFGTTAFQTVDGEEYENSLLDVPNCNGQIGAGSDAGGFVLENSQSANYNEIAAYDDVAEDARVRVREYLEIAPGLFEGETRFTGFVEDLTLSDDQQTLDFNMVSDMSRTGFLVGGRILTHRYCGAKFNRNGLLPSHKSACGWQTAQGGDPLACDHTFDGANGCIAHNNAPRFYCIRGLSKTPVVVVGDGSGGGIGTGGGSGFDYETRTSCFTSRNFVRMADNSRRRISDVRTGDFVKAFSPEKFGEITVGKVTRVYRHKVSEFAILHFACRRAIEATREHLFYVGAGRFQVAGALQRNNRVKFYDSRLNQWQRLKVDSLETIKRTETVYNLEVEAVKRGALSPHTYFVSDETDVLNGNQSDAAVHNLKPVYPV